MRHSSSRTLNQSRLAKLALSVMNSPNLLQAACTASETFIFCVEHTKHCKSGEVAAHKEGKAWEPQHFGLPQQRSCKGCCGAAFDH